MAADTPVVDQPVPAVIGRSSTGSENIPPSAMQPETRGRARRSDPRRAIP
jgi:hypothetical protein